MERALWKGGQEARTVEEGERNVKGWFLRSLGVDDVEGEVKDLAGTSEKPTVGTTASGSVTENPEDATGFWTRDEGLEEIRKNLKDA